MVKHFIIPDFLKHLKVDGRGYPIPFFVARPGGKPDFRLLDGQKQRICVDQHLCAVCGKKLIKGVYYFISGPIGAGNMISTDPAMHRECAEFSLQACPHLHFEKSQRRDKDVIQYKTDAQLAEKPPVFVMIKADKFKLVPNPTAGNAKTLIRYRAVEWTVFKFVDGVIKELEKVKV